LDYIKEVSNTVLILLFRFQNNSFTILYDFTPLFVLFVTRGQPKHVAMLNKGPISQICTVVFVG